MNFALFVAELERRYVPYTKASAARVVRTEAVKERDAAEPDTTQFCKALGSALVNQYGRDQETLNKFGVPAPKVRAKPTLDKKLAAAAKRQATREARGTKGSRQKKDIKATGDFTVSVTPVVSLAPTATNGATNGVVPAANGVEH